MLQGEISDAHTQISLKVPLKAEVLFDVRIEWRVASGLRRLSLILILLLLFGNPVAQVFLLLNFLEEFADLASDIVTIGFFGLRILSVLLLLLLDAVPESAVLSERLGHLIRQAAHITLLLLLLLLVHAEMLCSHLHHRWHLEVVVAHLAASLVILAVKYQRR